MDMPGPAALALAALVVLPLVAAVLRQGQGIDAAAFAHNAGRNGLLATTAGAVAGNIGIGTFVALTLFTQASPVIGLAIVIAYSMGFLLCAALAPAIRQAARRHGAVGLVDLLVAAHGIRWRVLVWLPVSAIFVLRCSVQLGALGVLIAPLTGGSAAAGVVIGAAVIGLYLTVGGYRAAVESDVVQAAVIVAVALLALPGALQIEVVERPFLDLGSYGPGILVGIALFLPWSTVLAVDNWQRIVLARSDAVARSGFLLALLPCLMVYGLVAWLGYASAPGASVFDGFAGLLPEGLGWLATLMFLAAIMSSIDTFLVPLASSWQTNQSLAAMRRMVGILMLAAASLALLLGDVLASVVAAFNSLTVLLPAMAGALLLRCAHAGAAIVSINGGLAVTLLVGLHDEGLAALAGAAAAFAAYGAVTWTGARNRPRAPGDPHP